MRRWLKLHSKEILSETNIDSVLDDIYTLFTDIVVTTDFDGFDGLATHRSSIFTQREERVNTWTTFDYFLTEAHQHGLRVHTWICVGLWDHWDGLASPINPDWNTAVLEDCEYDWLNMSISGARQLVADVAEELVTLHPGLDGVYLDYIRYRTVMSEVESLDPSDITSTVSACRDVTDGYELNAGVYMLTWNLANLAQQAWTSWLTSDLIDYALPMAYAYPEETAYTPAFAEILEDLDALDKDRVHPCISVIPHVSEGALTLAELEEEFDDIETAGFQGTGIWCYTALEDNPSLWPGVPSAPTPPASAITSVVAGQDGIGLKIEHTRRTVYVRPDYDLSGDTPTLDEMISVPDISVFSHVNDDSSLAVAIGAEPATWPEDA